MPENKMTQEEFDKFLKDIGGLRSCYKLDSVIDSVHCFNIGAGWLQLVKELIEDLIELGWDRQVAHVKEKFGGLRFYIGTGTDEICKRISEAEHESFKICEETGEPGELRTKGGWMRTLCDECYEKWLNE